MLEQIYGWIQNIAVYLIITTGVMHIVPGKEYGKYIRFFSGLILIVLLASPILRLAGLWEDFGELYRNREYEMETARIESIAEEYSRAGLAELFPEEYRAVLEENAALSAGSTGEDGIQESGADGRVEQKGRIEVEEIRIGE